VPNPATSRTPRLAEWEKLKYGMLINFGITTFTGEGDDGNSLSSLYAPTKLDARQWVRVAKDSGMGYAILTVKNKCGHCLWDSKHTNYDVATSSNQTDVVAEFMEACRAEGIKPGFYYAISDAYHEPGPGPLKPWMAVSVEQFNRIKGQLSELHSKYPDIYTQKLFVEKRLKEDLRNELYQLIKRYYNPNCLLSFQVAADSKELWPTDLRVAFEDSEEADFNPEFERQGTTYYMPQEVHAQIAEGWFYRPDAKLKSPEELLALWRRTVGRGANLLLNVPPDRTGRIPQKYVETLKEFKKLIDKEPVSRKPFPKSDKQ